MEILFQSLHNNYKQLLLTVAVLLTNICVIAQLPAELQTPELISINRMPMQSVPLLLKICKWQRHLIKKSRPTIFL